MTWLRQLGALSVVVLFLAGCTSDPKTTPKADDHGPTVAPTPGQCVAKETRDLDDVGPDFSTVVDCTKPHIYEIIDVFDVPAKFLRGDNKKDRLKNRTELAKVAGDNKLKDELHESSSAICEERVLKPVGLDKLKMNKKTAEQAKVSLTLGGGLGWVNLSPPEQWETGDAQMICSIRFSKHMPQGEPRDASPVTSKDVKPVFQRFLSGDFPLDRRQCVAYDADETRSLVTCDKQHYGEILYAFDALSVFGKEFVDGVVEEDELTDAQYEKLDAPCFDSLYTLFGDDFDEDLSAVVEFGPGGWEGDGDEYPLYCTAVPYDSEKFDLPGGTLFDESKDIEFAPLGDTKTV